MNDFRHKNLFRPTFRGHSASWELCRSSTRELMSVQVESEVAWERIEQIRSRTLQHPLDGPYAAAVRAAICVLCDLRGQGWNFAEVDGGIRLSRVSEGARICREQIQQMHLVNRNAQLRRSSVREFIESMERRRLTAHGWTSIFTLMRDGRELSASLERAKRSESPVSAVEAVFNPYIQFVREGEACEHTGLPLMDVWRYFRHTWSTEYQTVPGRNILVLIRDAAVKNHPVIGVAALASPVVHLTLRDEWLGWAPGQVIRQIERNPSSAWAHWALETLDSLLGEIYINDLIREGVLSADELLDPSSSVVLRLHEEATKSRERHRLDPQKTILKTPTADLGEAAWMVRSETHLFRAKRCEALAVLLETRAGFREGGLTEPTEESLSAAISRPSVRRGVELLRKFVKARRIGTDVLDISVCGAIAPYNEVLGGKLVAMLLTSPEVTRYYAHTYRGRASIIASSVAARPIRREPQLAVLTTTSLYGTSPNQYTRLSIPTQLDDPTRHRRVRYQLLGRTDGKGSFHFSTTTVDAIEILLSQRSHQRSVNSLFGEGVSPRLRKIRAGLDACGFPSDHVLTHGSSRSIYGVALIDNQARFLLGLEAQPGYLMSQGSPPATTASIARYWMQRWVIPRLGELSFERITRHSLVAPIEHAARVRFPQSSESEELFSDADT